MWFENKNTGQSTKYAGFAKSGKHEHMVYTSVFQGSACAGSGRFTTESGIDAAYLGWSLGNSASW